LFIPIIGENMSQQPISRYLTHIENGGFMKKLIFALIAIAAFLIAPNTTHADSTSDFAGTLKAAKQGDASAQYSLGCMYFGQDATKAVYWYTKAAEQGQASAQSDLGVMYSRGQGVAKDDTKAVYWVTKAAEQGVANAQNNLGVMYNNGEGVAKDYTKAVYWYTKAAEQGKASAQYNLGLKYANGEGVAKDMVLAYAWLNLAAINSDADAVKMRDMVERNLDPAGINEGQRLASNWEIGQSIKREQ
jgi:TPR repeat protein